MVPRLVWPNSLFFQVNWVMSKNKTSWRSITIYKRSVSTLHYHLQLLVLSGENKRANKCQGNCTCSSRPGKTPRQGVLGKGLKVKVSATSRCLSRATVSGCRRRLTVLMAPKLPSLSLIVWNCKTSPTINELSQIIINITNFVCRLMAKHIIYCILLW